ncbi:MAG: hypothetical protein AB1633_04890, partial [Elusimicrobiota bacterium]
RKRFAVVTNDANRTPDACFKFANTRKITKKMSAKNTAYLSEPAKIKLFFSIFSIVRQGIDDF